MVNELSAQRGKLCCAIFFKIFFKKGLTIAIGCDRITFVAALAGVAQLVEQLICNQQVGGSSPSTSSNATQLNMGEFPSGQRGQTVNLLLFSFDGPNPSSPTKTKTSPIGLVFCFGKRVVSRNIGVATVGC